MEEAKITGPSFVINRFNIYMIIQLKKKLIKHKYFDVKIVFSIVTIKSTFKGGSFHHLPLNLSQCLHPEQD